MSTEHWLQLALADGLGPVTLKRLLDATGSAQGACAATPSLLRSIEGIGPAKSETIYRGLASAAHEAPRHLQRALEQNVSILCLEDPDYPPLLKGIHDPPPVLFVRGRFEPRDLNGIAIVGSRGCSFYGKEQAQRFGANLAASGFTIISGGARGVDSAAHRGALTHPNGRTIAVLGCGVDITYPPENEKLFAEIARSGAVISEYPLGAQPLAENFPRRNRIVSGMSRGVLVVEADERSGALITAHVACEQNRMVFALPGRIDNRMSHGPHKLIREGATLITSVQDIIEDLEPLPADIAEGATEISADLFESAAQMESQASGSEQSRPEPLTPPVEPARQAAPRAPLTAQQQTVLSAIEDEATSVDTIVERTGLAAYQILQELTMLSLKGLIRRVDGQSYCRK